MAIGTVVQSKNVGKDLMAGMKTLVGGEITSYTQMINDARRIAVERMVAEAERGWVRMLSSMSAMALPL